MKTRVFISALVVLAMAGVPAIGQSTPTPAPVPAAAANGKSPPTDVVAAQRRVPDSVMFSIDELNDIQSRASAQTDAAGGKKDSTAIENASLYLSTIVYYGPKDWTIWVNGAPIGPSQDFQAFTITEIGPSYVELLVPLSAQGMRPVRLAPNQTFIAKSGAIVEGPWK
jgi:hypothetical protein